MIAGNYSAQAIFTSGGGQDGAIYFFTSKGKTYEIGVHYDIGGSGNVASNKALADSILATLETTGGK